MTYRTIHKGDATRGTKGRKPLIDESPEQRLQRVSGVLERSYGEVRSIFFKGKISDAKNNLRAAFAELKEIAAGARKQALRGAVLEQLGKYAKLDAFLSGQISDQAAASDNDLKWFFRL